MKLGKKIARPLVVWLGKKLKIIRIIFSRKLVFIEFDKKIILG